MLTNAPPLHHHIGVYAVVESARGVLVVVKARGPYLGLLDLPGGGAEHGESREQTLRRELQEEVGTLPAHIGRWMEFSLRVRRDSCGAPVNFLHEGHFARVRIVGQVDAAGTCGAALEDVAGVCWAPRSQLESRPDVSALLRHALEVTAGKRPTTYGQ